MSEPSGNENGRAPQERRDEALREDRALKREVDEALREWDRLTDNGSSSRPVERAQPGRRGA